MSKTVIASDFDGNPHKVEISKLVWRPSAYGIIIKDNKILLLKQTNGYDLPGGGMNMGETPEEAVIREVKEETGLAVKNPKLLAVGNSFYLAYGTTDKFRQAIMLYYTCEYVGGELSTAGFDEAEQEYGVAPQWLPTEELNFIKIGSNADFRPFIKTILEKK